MSTHPAVVTVGAGQPLQIHQVETPIVKDNEIRVLAQWTASTPLDLHQADGGLLVNPPQVLGDGIVGPVVQVGPDVSQYKVSDVVFGFTWRNQAEKAHQKYVVAPEFLFGKVPGNVTKQQAVTVPNNFVTAWHSLTKEFGFELPWPKPAGYVPPESDQGILVWGGSASVGQFALQILKYYGYKHVAATAGKAHHEKLHRYGASTCFEYRDTDIEEKLLSFQSNSGKFMYILDCIGSQNNSVLPISRIAQDAAKVAIMLPVIVKDAAVGVKPIYEMDVEKAADWPADVVASGVRTHFWMDNLALKERLQPEIMPAVLEQGILEPNEPRIVEGSSLLERAEKALSILRDRGVSGQRLVWRVADED
jgi:NADPH:quinone reductase-like Zn-dependent oxidoreductase